LSQFNFVILNISNNKLTNQKLQNNRPNDILK